MPLSLEVVNRQKALPLDLPKIRRTVRAILKQLGVAEARLSVVFVTDGEMRKINRTYLQHDYTTDVLSFNLTAPVTGTARLPAALRSAALEGDVIVCPAMARRQAKVYACAPQDELTLYLIHGILHLLGYDDHGADAVRRMRRKEAELMAALKPTGGR